MLELLHLRKRYGDVVALDDLSLTVPPGGLVGFLGPNGAGKTTAMRSVFALVRLDGGTVQWQGRPVDGDARRRFGYMPEERGLYPRMRIGEQLTYLATLHGLSRPDAVASAARWLTRVGLADRAGVRLEQLSHGNQQRVQLAAALVHEPQLLVLDEPFAGLDPLGVETMAEILAGYAAGGAAVVFSSHQLDLVEDVCSEVVVINRGSVVLAGRVAELKAASTVRHVEIRLADGEPVRLPFGPGVEPVAEKPGYLRLRVGPEADLVALLRAARSSGSLVEFAFEPPSLSDLFREAVS